MKKLKNEVKEVDIIDGPKLTRQQYLEWRCLIYDIDVEKYRLTEKQLRANLIAKEVENWMMKKVLLQKEIAEQLTSISNAEKKYLEHKEKLGHEIGTTLDGKVIDPISLTVKDIDQKEK